MRDATGAEESIPIGIFGGFFQLIVVIISKVDSSEPPSAGFLIGSELGTGQGNTTERRAGDDLACTGVTEVEVERIS